MKSLIEYINEGRTIDEIVIKDQNNKDVNVVYYCYDKNSLDKVIKQYESVGKYWKGKGFFLASLKNKSTWTIDNDKEFHMNTWKPNGEFLEYEDEIDHNEVYTYNELVNLLEKGETMLVVINK
jgi:hypothetical protein